MTVSICIATFRRQEKLRALLNDIAAQKSAPHEIVVVDNDAAGSARAVVEERRKLGLPCPLRYEIQPRQNISLARNRTVELASGKWLALFHHGSPVMPPPPPAKAGASPAMKPGASPAVKPAASPK